MAPSHYHRDSDLSDMCAVAPPQFNEARRLHSSSREMSELINENLQYYARIKDLEHLLQTQSDEKGKLYGKLELQGRTIQKLVEQTSQTKEDELDMASEIIQLKRDLAKEKKKNERIHREIERKQDERDFGASSMSECREKELLERLKDAREEAELSRQESSQASARTLGLEEERENLIAKVSSLTGEVKDLRKAAGEGEAVKGVNEELEMQLRETRKAMEEQLKALETLRKENFELLRRPLSIMVEPETSKENLEGALQLQLRRRIDRVEGEKERLEKKLKEYEALSIESIDKEKDAIQKELEANKKRLEEATHQVVRQKCEFEKLLVETQQVKSQLSIAEETLSSETLKWTKRIEQLEERMKRAEEQRNAAENSLKTQGSSKNEIIDQLYKSRTLIEKLECDNRQLRAQIEALNAKVEEEKREGLRLRTELEETLKPEIAQLQEHIRTAESANERLKGDLELKEYLLKEEETVAKQVKAKLEKAQQRLEESEARVTQTSRLTSDQAERLAKSEAANKQKDIEIHDLKKKVSSLKSTIDLVKLEFDAAKASNEKLAQLNESLESRHLLSGDEHQRLLSDVAFYRQELERLADYHTLQNSTTGAYGGGKARGEPLKAVLDGLKRQILSTKEELKALHTEIGEQIKNLPIESSGTSEEFEIIHIVEHFQREKRKVVEELRAATLHLSDAECSYQSLLEEHQSLKRAHAQTLKDLLDLKQQTSTTNMVNNPIVVDACIGTNEKSDNVCPIVDENVFVQRAPVKPSISQISTTTTQSLKDSMEHPRTDIQNETHHVDERPVSQQSSSSLEAFSGTSPLHQSLRSSDRRQPISPNTPAQHHPPSLASSSSGNESQIPSSEQRHCQSAQIKPPILDQRKQIAPTATPLRTPSSVQQKIAIFDKNRVVTESSVGPSLPRPGQSTSGSQTRTSPSVSPTASTSQSLNSSQKQLAVHSSPSVTPFRTEQPPDVDRPLSGSRTATLLGSAMTREEGNDQRVKQEEKAEISGSGSSINAPNTKRKHSKPSVQTRSSSRNKRIVIESHKLF